MSVLLNAVGVCRKHSSQVFLGGFHCLMCECVCVCVCVCVCEDDVAKPTDPHLFPVSPLKLSSRTSSSLTGATGAEGRRHMTQRTHF